MDLLMRSFLLTALSLLACEVRHDAITPNEQGGSGFDRSLVRVSVTSTKGMLGDQIDIYFVKNATDEELLALARECVHDYAGERTAAYCYAFRSDADFEYAQVDRNEGGMEHLCWRAMYDRNLDGTSLYSEFDSQIYDHEGCPGASRSSTRSAAERGEDRTLTDSPPAIRDDACLRCDAIVAESRAAADACHYDVSCMTAVEARLDREMDVNPDCIKCTAPRP